MAEKRDKTDTSGRGLGHSWADDNVERGAPDADFEKRRPTYPLGDDPRGREIDFEDDSGRESYGKNDVYRAYRGQAPIEGQEYGAPVRAGKIYKKVQDLRPEQPNRSTNIEYHAALQAGQAAELTATNFQALMPSPTISTPAPGASFSPGATLEVIAPTTALRNLHSAILEINGLAVERRVIDRRDQDSTTQHDFHFFYTIPSNQPLGSMSVTVRVFNMESAFRGVIADDALFTTNVQTGIGSAEHPRPGSATSSDAYQLQLDDTGILRQHAGAVSITVNIV
jgi:hypothetical protein